MQSAIAAWIATQIPGSEGVSLSGITAANGGLSSETVFCRAAWKQDGTSYEKKLVLRIRPDDHQVIPDPDTTHQYLIMKLLGERSGVPVPRMWLAESTGSVIGSPFFLMEEVHGTVLLPAAPQAAHPESEPAKWSSDDLSQIYRNAIDVMAAIHLVDPGQDLDFLRWPGTTAFDGALAQTQRWYDWARRGRDIGVIDVAMKWVTDNRPESTESVLCWGDARPGNMVVAPDLSIAAVLDWEMAVLGPPELDLGWWLMFERVAFEGFRQECPDGVPSREETIARYETALGRSVNDIHYFEILAALKLAVINIRLLELDAYGPISAGWILESTPERMIIGDPFTRLLATWLDLDVTGGSRSS
jgi:aminoglycoside phosphotransferase (APT) family kinase protein